MRVLILTHGTRGDVQPFAALARALDTAGHSVVLGAPARSADLAADYGLDFTALDDGPNHLLAEPDIRAMVENGFRGVRGKLAVPRILVRIRPLIDRVLADMVRVAESSGADVIVHSPTMPAQHVAEWLGVPAVPAVLQPTWVPTRAFPCPVLPLGWVPSALNRATYLPVRLLHLSMAGVIDKWRRTTLGLGRRRGRHDFLRRSDGDPATVLQAFSRHLLPLPLDWPEHVHITGYWFLSATEWRPPQRLSDFLAAGPPPVYIGFGSMAGGDPQRTGRAVVEAARRAGKRAVLVAGWGGVAPDDLDDDVLLLEQAPHDWLFPRCSAIVHHGGAGTTAAALAAGRPQVVCPFAADQPFWARRAHAVGVAPAPQPQHQLTTEGLAAAIGRAVTDSDMARRAADLGARVRAEEGAATAVQMLEQVHAGQPRG
ncbi:glycosyltransferase [Salinactinospora qingdaonensis]|uniref:Glycosyltransferase n=1 Tax=Salinactinospora qingdaonensis TaxID=702744 RepID=A0ABP7FGA0_9ACTN